MMHQDQAFGVLVRKACAELVLAPLVSESYPGAGVPDGSWDNYEA